MIEMSVKRDETGLLRRCEVRGHAEAAPAGEDIVCAAVSVLVRTAYAVLAGRDDIAAKCRAERRGAFLLETKAKGEAGRAYLAAVGDFLLAGLGSVAAEFPKNCRLTGV